MAETLAYNFVGNDELSRVFEALDRVAGKLERTFDHLGSQASQTGRKMGAAGTEAKGAGEEFKGVGDDAEKAGHKIDQLGDDMDKAALKAAVFDAQIRQTRRSVRELSDEFVRTGDADILAKLGLKQGRLAELEKLRGELGNVGKEVEKLVTGGGKGNKGGLLDFALDEWIVRTGKAAASAVTTGLESGVQSAGKAISSNPWIAAAVAAGITIGIPVIGAALTAAIGAGGIAAGVLLAAKDPQVGAAWSEFASSAQTSLTSAASIFVDPLVRGATRFGKLMDNIMPSIRADFASLAPALDSLVNGVAGLVERMMPGINAMIKESGPILTQLAHDLPEVGAALGVMFKEISAGAGSGAHALHDMLTWFEGTLITIGAIVWALEKWYGAERVLFSFMTGDMSGAVKQMSEVLGLHREQYQKVGPAAQAAFNAASRAIGTTGETLQNLSAKIGQTALNADTLAGQMTDKLMGSMLGMSHATLGVAESLTGLHDTFAQNGLAIDKHTGLVGMNTQAGQRNRESVLSAIESNLRMYDTQIASGVGADVAAQKYGENTKALHDQLRQAGLTEGQVHDLIGEYGNVPKKVNTDIALKGLTDAINGIDNLLRRLNGLTYTRTITIDQVTRHIDVGPRPGEVGPYYGGLAYGGRAGKRAMGGTYDVGENGPERVVLPDGAYVIPNNQMSRGPGAGGSDDVIGVLEVRHVSPTGAVMQTEFLKLAKERGYRDVTQLLPVGR